MREKSVMSTWKAVAVAAVVGAFMAAPAMAAPIQFTWNPNGSTPPLGGSQFTANNMIVSDFSTIHFQPGGAFTEQGILPVSNFQNGGSFVTAPGLNSAYGLYFAFNATGTINNGSGSFNTLTYTLMGDPGYTNGALSATPSGVSFANGNAGDVTLASGSLLSSAVTINAQGIPGASSTETFVQAPGQSGFFVAPTSIALNLSNAFTNDANVISGSLASGTLLINGGGGNATFQVPEPASFAVLGAGLLGLAMARRKRLI